MQQFLVATEQREGPRRLERLLAADSHIAGGKLPRGRFDLPLPVSQRRIPIAAGRVLSAHGKHVDSARIDVVQGDATDRFAHGERVDKQLHVLRILVAIQQLPGSAGFVVDDSYLTIAVEINAVNAQSQLDTRNAAANFCSTQ